MSDVAVPMYQASGQFGSTSPSTGPDLIRWAEFHNMQYEETPSMFHHFKVLRCDLKPLSEDEVEAFSECRWRPPPNPGVVEDWQLTPEAALSHGRALAKLHRRKT